ncbi:unnamed protein product [Strongylus vulgaris]|uniref:Uncharacterized protein n=1 Tax=Strongylus vulgaris TaxID=40348 RepID=A0A3P7LLJ0_STRVU|nr:unnamed protein product [Strongylus vulgaris]
MNQGLERGCALLGCFSCLPFGLQLGAGQNVTDKFHIEERNESTTERLLRDNSTSAHIFSESSTSGKTIGKIPVVKGLVLLLMIAAGLVAGALVCAFFLWLASKKLVIPTQYETVNVAPRKKEEGLQELREDPTPSSKSQQPVRNETVPTKLVGVDFQDGNAVYTPPSQKEESYGEHGLSDVSKEKPKVEITALQDEKMLLNSVTSKRIESDFEKTKMPNPEKSRRSTVADNSFDSHKKETGMDELLKIVEE